MTTAWEQIGVRTVLDIGETKAACQRAAEGDSNDSEFEALNDYIDVLEGALHRLGIHIHDNGAVSPTGEGVVHT